MECTASQVTIKQDNMSEQYFDDYRHIFLKKKAALKLPCGCRGSYRLLVNGSGTRRLTRSR